jgi:hypothetical protein
MKSIKFYAVAAALVSSLLSLAAYSQGQASIKKAGGSTQATCNYTGLTIINGALEVTCVDDLAVLTGGGGGATGPYALSVSTSPSSSGTVGGPLCTTGSTGGCNGTVPASTATSVTATAVTGYTFAKWVGGPCDQLTSATCSWTMTGGVVMQATFTSNSGGGGGGGVVPAGCTGLTPTTNYELKTSIGPPSQSTRHEAPQGKIVSFPLPSNKGNFATSTTVYTPGQLQVEASISQCPGDMGYYKTDPAKVLLYGTLRQACGGVYGAESGGFRWSTGTSPYYAFCQTPEGQPWYVNIRFVEGTCPTGTCEIYYTWSSY